MRHVKELLISVIVLVLVICNVGLIVKISQKDERQDRMAESLSLLNKYYYTLESTSLLQFKYNDRILKDFIITDIDNIPHKLSSIFQGDEFKIILKISHRNCTPCVDNELENLYRISKKIGIDQIVVLCESGNMREFTAYFKALEYPFTCFYIAEENSLQDVIRQENVPFVFLMNRDLRIRNLFIPSKELPDYSKAYYNMMAIRYWNTFAKPSY